MDNSAAEECLEFYVHCSTPARAKTAAGTIDLNRWVHIAAVFDGDTKVATVYINGVEASYLIHQTGAGIHYSDANNVMAVGNSTTLNRSFDGAMDELRVWNVARTQAQIQDNLDNVVDPASSGLVAYYRFNHGTACGVNTGVTSLTDLTTNANTGALSGFDLSTADCTSNWIGSAAITTPVVSAATGITCTGFTANWAAPVTGTVDKYYLEIATDAAFTNKITGYNPYKDMGTALTENVTGLTIGQTYYYRVRGYKTALGDVYAYSPTISVAVVDAVAPTITCPGTQSLNANTSCQATLPSYISMATATDGCDATPTITQLPASGTVISASTTVTLTATDDSGNSSNCSFTVNLNDVTNPTVTCPGNQNVSMSSGCNAVLPNFTSMATATDNCDVSVAKTQSPASGTTISSATTVTITATDDAGNSSQCTFTATPVDATNPTITNPGNQTVSANASCQATVPNLTTLPTVSDNCDATPTVTQSPLAGTTITGTTTVTLTVTDDAGNTASCNFSLSIVDDTDPLLVDPGDQNVEANASCTATLPDFRPLATASDNCDATVTKNQSPVPGTAMTGTVSVTITAIDDSGNSSQVTFTAFLIDVTSPVITNPGDQDFYSDANCDVILPDYTGLVSVSDNCDASLTVIQFPAPGSTIHETTTINLSSTDDSGNVGYCLFDAIVHDAIDPEITCSTPSALYANAACEAIVPDYTSLATATDNCDTDIQIDQYPLPGTEIINGTTVTLTANDNDGNTASCSFVVEVLDTIAPVISCWPDLFGCPVTPITFNITATDNCSAYVVQTQGLPSTSTPPIGETVYEFVAYDYSGNTDTCTFLVTIIEHPDVNLHDTLLCKNYGEIAVLDATPSVPGVYTYNWSNGGITPTMTINSDEYEIGIEYFYVTVTNITGCMTIDTAMVEISICSGINSLNSNSTQIIIYPNPFEDIINISVKEPFEMILTDVSGKELLSKNLTKGINSIDVSMFNPGVYFVEIRNNEFNKRFKIIRK